MTNQNDRAPILSYKRCCTVCLLNNCMRCARVEVVDLQHKQTYCHLCWTVANIYIHSLSQRIFKVRYLITS